MADITTGYTWVSGETVTPGKLNQAVSDATITGIVNADIDAAAAISLSKLNLGSGITSSQLADGAVTGAAGGGKLAASAITGQTTIADALADTDEFLVHDASATALRKVAYSNISPTVTAAKLNGVAKDGSGNNISAGTAAVFGCRAWVNFDGTKDTTGAASTANTNRLIRASGNVTSVKREAAGSYTVTFTTAMPDANYAPSGLAGDPPTGTATLILFGNANPSTTELRVSVMNTSSQGVDRGTVSVAVFR